MAKFAVFEISADAEPKEFGQYWSQTDAQREGDAYLSRYQVVDLSTGEVVLIREPAVGALGSHADPTLDVGAGLEGEPGADVGAVQIRQHVPVGDERAQIAAQLMAGMAFGARTQEQMRGLAELAVVGADALLDVLAGRQTVLVAQSVVPSKMEKKVVGGRTVIRPKRG